LLGGTAQGKEKVARLRPASPWWRGEAAQGESMAGR
jgi:hypothetical protein